MNREIKFRAWDIFKKVFIPTDTWAVTTSNEGYFAVMIKDWENYRAGEYMYPDTQVLMQYTGLKDRHGKEIYEGDIVKLVETISVWQDCGDLFRVWFEDGAMLYGGLNNEWDEYLRKMPPGVEVIGNIYEHSHLLKTE